MWDHKNIEERKQTEPLQTNEDKILPAEKACFIHETFSANLAVTTKNKCGAETWNMKMGKLRKTSQKNTRQKRPTETQEKETMTVRSNQKAEGKMAILSSHSLVTALNINGLNSLIKRQGGWMD